MSIVDTFDDGLHSASRRKRLRTAFKVATHSRHIQRFRETLNDTKATLTLAMVHERHGQILPELIIAKPQQCCTVFHL
jgi:hypothetical protein